MKQLFKITTITICIALFGFVCFLGYSTISDYKPGKTALIYENVNANAIEGRKQFAFMIWNIGYGGLGKDMDFFYDGGKQIRTARKNVDNNMDTITKFIAQQRGIDFFLFQEVDKNSKRSYFINEYLKIKNIFSDFHSGFGKNYDVFFVPVPPLEPLGNVLSGLQTLSRFEPASIIRHSFPGNYAWPQGLFMLDRCFLVSRYLLEDIKNADDTTSELVVINTHNSAYDDGTLRGNQMAYLKDFLTKEYTKGNYAIVGGDWNQCPPGFNPDFSNNLMDHDNRMDIEQDYLPAWTWAYDTKIPTNRRLATQYDETSSLTTVIDFFLLSPNIEIVKVEGINLGFEHSDHQPVKVKIKLRLPKLH